MTIVVGAVFHGNQIFRWMSIWKIKMIYYDRIEVSEGIDVNKTITSKECNVCH